MNRSSSKNCAGRTVDRGKGICSRDFQSGELEAEYKEFPVSELLEIRKKQDVIPGRKGPENSGKPVSFLIKLQRIIGNAVNALFPSPKRKSRLSRGRGSRLD
jgi:hypothetical protein